MLGKIISHEFRASARQMWPLLTGLAGLALIVRFVAYPVMHAGSSFFSAICGFLIFLFFLGMFALSFAPLVISGSRFKSNVLGDEGYLTMCLPVSTDCIIGGKLISNAIWYAITGAFVLIIAVFMLVTMDFLSFPSVNFFIQLPDIVPDYGNTGELVLHCVVLFLELLLNFTLFVTLATILVYAAYSIGFSAERHKSLWTVILIYSFFNITSVVSVFLSFGIAKDFSPSLDSFKTAVGTAELILLVPVFVMLLLSAVYYFITRFFITHRLNLE